MLIVMINNFFLFIIFIVTFDIVGLKLLFGCRYNEKIKERLFLKLIKYKKYNFIYNNFWLKLYKYFLIQNNFNFALISDINLAEKLFRSYNSTKNLYIKNRIYNTIRLLSNQDIIYNKIENNKISGLKYLYFTKSIIDLDIEEMIKTIDEESLITRTENQIFFELINNKEIGIVGPGAIGDFDDNNYAENLIIRSNFLNDCDNKRADISYYNGGTTQKIVDGNFEIPSSIKYMVLRTNNKEFKHNIPFHCLENVNVLYNMTLMGIQRIIFDLLFYKPKSIKIYNSDFYTGKKIYEQGYIGAKYSLLPVNTLIKHNLVQNFALTKAFFNAKLIEGDSVFQKVINLSIEEYASILETNYKLQFIKK